MCDGFVVAAKRKQTLAQQEVGIGGLGISRHQLPRQLSGTEGMAQSLFGKSQKVEGVKVTAIEGTGSLQLLDSLLVAQQFEEHPAAVAPRLRRFGR